MANAVQKFIQKALGINVPDTRQADTTAAEARSVALSNTPGMMSLFNISDGNVAVNDPNIQGIPALSRAIEIVASAVAKLPVSVFTKNERGIKPLDNHPAALLCNVAPNLEQIPYTFWWSMVANAMLSGGGGAEIIRNDNGRPIALRLMRIGCTPYKLNTYDPLRYYDNEDGKLFFPEDVLFLPGIFVRDGFTARPLAVAFRNTFGETLAQTLLSNTLFKQGVYPSAVYSYTGTKTGVKGDEAQALDISRYFGGLEKAGMVLPIPNMDKFTQLRPVSFVDAQMLDSRKFGIAEISRITGVPADMLGEIEKQSYSFSEMSAKNFTLFCLDPWLTKRDQEIRVKLLTASEQGRISVETMVDETLWMLPKERVEYWNKLHQMGAINADQIRAYLNQSPIEDGSGKTYYVQSQLIPTHLIEEFWAAKNDKNTGTQPAPAERSAKLNGHATIAN